jgi:hypothetical protein
MNGDDGGLHRHFNGVDFSGTSCLAHLHGAAAEAATQVPSLLAGTVKIKENRERPMPLQAAWAGYDLG